MKNQNRIKIEGFIEDTYSEDGKISEKGIKRLINRLEYFLEEDGYKFTGNMSIVWKDND